MQEKVVDQDGGTNTAELEHLINQELVNLFSYLLIMLI